MTGRRPQTLRNLRMFTRHVARERQTWINVLGKALAGQCEASHSTLGQLTTRILHTATSMSTTVPSTLRHLPHTHSDCRGTAHRAGSFLNCFSQSLTTNLFQRGPQTSSGMSEQSHKEWKWIREIQSSGGGDSDVFFFFFKKSPKIVFVRQYKKSNVSHSF